MSDSLKDFLQDALQAHDAGSSFSDAPTVVASSPVSKSEMGTLPGHEVQGFIARGGMGAIYLARQQALEREVAVKVMTAEAGSAEMAERFRREALVLGRLAHPNIVPVYDISTDDEGQLFYTMKLVKGRTLQHILNDLRAEDPEALRTHTLTSLLTVFHKVCDALAFAHSQGIIHRDLKPENVMVGEFGEVLVMDWGLAKKLSEKAETPMAVSPSSMMIRKTDFGGTLSGSVMGTPQYMSPEQAMGLVNELDARSDIFSLGGILYAILTLRPPVEGDTLEEVLEKVRMGSIASPSAFGTTREGTKQVKGAVLEARKIMPLPHVDTGKVPPALSAVAMKALRLDKAKRYQSVAEFSADIEAYQGGFATTAEQAGLGKQLVLLIRRNKGIFTTAAAAWLIITALGGWFVLNLRAKELRAIAGEEAALVEKEAARRSAAAANISLADAAMREGNGQAMGAALDRVPQDLRDSTWGYLQAQSDTSIASIPDIEAVAADPTRRGVFAVANRSRRVTVLDVRSGKRLLDFDSAFPKKDNDGLTRLAFSPDGQRIAVARSSAPGILIHSARDGAKLVEWGAEPSRQLDFSADGSLLLQHLGRNRDEERLAMWDSSTGESLWKNHVKRDAYGAFTPDSTQVLTMGGDGSILLLNARDGTLVREILDKKAGGLGAGTHSFATGPGDLLALATFTQNVVVLDWRQGRIVTRFQLGLAANDSFNLLEWTPDGSRLVSTGMAQDGRQMIRLWEPRTGWMTRSLLGGGREVRDVAVHPLSGELLVAGPAGRAWSITSLPPRWTLMRSAATRFVFWGTDDDVIGPAPRSLGTLQKIGSDGATPLWKPEEEKVRNPTVSHDGRWAVLVDPSKRLNPHLLLRREGDRVEKVADLKSRITATAARISPAGDRVLAYGEDKVELLAIPGGEEKTRLDLADVRWARDFEWLSSQRIAGLVTAKGDRLETGSEERVVLWDASTGKVLQTAVHPGALDVLAVAPDGSRLAEAGEDKMVRVRDAETLAVLREFRAHDGPITALAWHPTLRVLATASTDLTIRLWDLDTGRRLEEFNGLMSPAANLTFSPSGRRLLGGGSDATRIWDLPPVFK
ncbi:MAG: protein kinase domain-containing protein [Prosthecobacter sp.]